MIKWRAGVFKNIRSRSWIWYGRWLSVRRRLKTSGMSLLRAVRGILILFLKAVLTIWQDIRLWSTYHRCYNTSIFCFSEALRGDVSALRRRLLPASKKTLEMARSHLLMEYCELSGNASISRNLNMMKEWYSLQIQIEKLKCYLNLHAYGRDVENDIFELTGVTGIDAAKATLVTWTNDCRQMYDEIKSELGDKTDAKGVDISLLIVEVQKYLCFGFNQKTTTVTEFAGYLKSYQSAMENSKKLRK